MIDKKTRIRSKLLAPFVININPNIISLLSLIAAILGGMYFYYNLISYAVLFVFLNGFFDALDGEIARKRGASVLGDFLDHTFDRLSDVAILLGITLGGYVPEQLGFFLIIITLLVSYLGTEAQALTKGRLYAGLLGRAERLVLIMIFGILQLVYGGNMIYDGILILIAFSIITFIQRFVKIYRDLK